VPGKLHKKLIARAANRAANDGFFLGSALEAYRGHYGFSDAQLASLLRCSVENLPRLGLCKRPDPSSSSFREDVERIAAYAVVDPLALGRLLREIDAISALRSGRDTTEAAGLLMAARDREGETKSPDEKSNRENRKHRR